MDKIIDVALGILTELRPVLTNTDKNHTDKNRTDQNVAGQSSALQDIADQPHGNTTSWPGPVSNSPLSSNDSSSSIKATLTSSNKERRPPAMKENVAGTEFRILIARRPSHTVYGGYWELPGGKIDPGETPTQALVREFEEELGIQIEAGDPLDEVIHSYPHAKVRLFPFFCKRVSGRIQNLAVSEHRWVLPKDLKSFKFPGANLPITDQMLQILQQNTPLRAPSTP